MKIAFQHNARQSTINGTWERFEQELRALGPGGIERWWASQATQALVNSMPPEWQNIAEEAYTARYAQLRRG